MRCKLTSSADGREELRGRAASQESVGGWQHDGTFVDSKGVPWGGFVHAERCFFFHDWIIPRYRRRIHRVVDGSGIPALKNKRPDFGLVLRREDDSVVLRGTSNKGPRIC